MKYNIDKYFKNKLDIPQQPPEDAWEFIQNHIQQKEKKRIIPFWYKIAGVAALVLVSFGIALFWNSVFQTNDSTNQTIFSKKVNSTNKNESSSNSQSSHQKKESNSTSNLEETAHLTEKTYNKTNTSSLKTTHYNSQEKLNSNNNLYPTFSTEPPNSSNINETVPEELIVDLNQPEWKNERYENPIYEKSILPEKENPVIEEKPLLAVNNKMEEKNQKEKSKKTIDFDRFYISGFASPMSLNTFVGSSMLADAMSDYKTENSITLAYGVKGAYAINQNVKLRTGVSVIGFEQITKDVPLSINLDSRPVANSAKSTNIAYSGNLTISPFSDDEFGRNTSGDTQQQSQYIEIPLEAEITLFKTNSIGISATGGGSTWLLSKNKIYVHTDDYTQELGKATNLNKTSFSANAGVKFDMKLMDNVDLNIEPSFKYLINPVNNIERYNPYTVGVNAGVTISLK